MSKKTAKTDNNDSKTKQEKKLQLSDNSSDGTISSLESLPISMEVHDGSRVLLQKPTRPPTPFHTESLVNDKSNTTSISVSNRPYRPVHKHTNTEQIDYSNYQLDENLDIYDEQDIITGGRLLYTPSDRSNDSQYNNDIENKSTDSNKNSTNPLFEDLAKDIQSMWQDLEIEFSKIDDDIEKALKELPKTKTEAIDNSTLQNVNNKNKNIDDDTQRQ